VDHPPPQPQQMLVVDVPAGHQGAPPTAYLIRSTIMCVAQVCMGVVTFI
jgi:hypothetical protein